MARKTSNSALKTSSNWDPFNCSFVDMQLSSLNSDNTSHVNNKVVEPQEFNGQNNALPSDIQSNPVFNSSMFLSNTSEPKDMRQTKENFKLSDIKYRYQSFGESVDKASDSSENTGGESFGFSSDFSHFSEPKSSKIDLDLNLSANNSGNSVKFMADFPDQSLFNNLNFNNSSVFSSDPNEDHISPPERNIFIQKSDPFADDFFAP